MSKIQYCAKSEEGIENWFDTQEECEKWITETETDNGIEPGYYELIEMDYDKLMSLPEM